MNYRPFSNDNGGPNGPILCLNSVQCSKRLRASMQQITYPNDGFRLSDRHRREVATIFDRTPAEGSEVIDVVEQAIGAYLQILDQASSNREIKRADAPAQEKQKKLAQKISKAARKLEELVQETIAIECQVDSYHSILNSTYPGTLARVAGTELELDLSLLSAEDAQEAAIESASVAYSNALQNLTAIRRASDLWMENLGIAKVGRPRARLYDLVLELDRIWRSIISQDEAGSEKWDQKPAAPNSPLCRLTEIALEAIGEDAHSNIPLLVRRALREDEVTNREWEREADQWAAQVEQKFGKSALPFRSQ